MRETRARWPQLSLADQVFDGWPVIVDDDWLKVLQVPQYSNPVPYLVLGKGWAPREWHDGAPARALTEPVATLLVRLPSPQRVHLELNSHSLDGSGALVVRLGEEPIGTYSLSDRPTVITTPTLSLPAGESVVHIYADAVPGNVIFKRTSLIVDE